jgi:uroporphyrinogen III methyltransferase/synthase
LPDGLRQRGWTVDVLPVYRTQPLAPAATDADAITFMSSSAVDAYVDANGIDRVPPVVACIGPITAETARARGLTVHVEASDHSIGGLVDGLVAHVAS